MIRCALVFLGLAGAAWSATSCKPGLPVRVAVKARGTPVVGEVVELEVQAHNDDRAGRFRCWLAFPAGALEPVDAVAWDDDLAEGASVTHTARVLVRSSDKVPVTAKLRPVEEPAAAEAYLKLYPFERTNGALSARWAASRPLPVTVMSDGAVVNRIRLAR